MSTWEKNIEDDLRWREEEIASMKALAATSPKGSARERALLRALWAMLYAHYEGFCKFAWDLYLDELERRGIKRSLCDLRLAEFSLLDDLGKLRTCSSEEMMKFCADFNKLMDEPIRFGTRLKTNSNLWPHLFKENAEAIGLRCTHIDQNETKIKSLVARRNEIAHGERMFIKSVQEFSECEENVLIVMHELGVEIVNALTNDKLLSNEQ